MTNPDNNTPMSNEETKSENMVLSDDKIPLKWKWDKCYELSYISSRNGREFLKKHWSLVALDKDGKRINTRVCSFRLVLQDTICNRAEIDSDEVLKFIESAPETIARLNQTIADIEKDACEFPNWLIENDYQRESSEKWFKSLSGLFTSSTRYTTAQLYQQFKLQTKGKDK